MLSRLFLFLVGTSLITKVFSAECTVPHLGTEDDSPAILKAFSDCRVNSVITFSQANYSAFTPISLTGLKNVTVYLNGNLLLPQNISRVQHEINITNNQPSTYATPWFYIHGEEVSIIGSDDVEWGTFHGFGEQWWNNGNRILRPQLATFNVTNGLLRKLKVIKPIAWGWNIPGKNVRVEDHFVDAAPHNGTRDNTIGFPFNTDGLNLSGQNITIDGYYGHNGDDCVSVINGAKDIIAQNGYCGFSSHGLSIGSLGKDGAVQTVQNVLFKNWTMDGAVYGARFKSWTGGQGFADNVSWEDITMVGVSTGIFITQNYYDQEVKGGKPGNINQTSTKISNFSFKNFTGSLASNWTDGTCISDPCWNFVDGINNTTAIIFDLFPGTALNISVQEINIHPQNKSSDATTVICDPSALVPGEQNTLGFQCKTGPFVETGIQTSGAAHINMAAVALIPTFFMLVSGMLLYC